MCHSQDSWGAGASPRDTAKAGGCDTWPGALLDPVVSKTQDWPHGPPTEIGGAAAEVSATEGVMGRTPSRPGAGADFSGLVLSPEMGEESFIKCPRLQEQRIA